jgi:hypothetical protein
MFIETFFLSENYTPIELGQCGFAPLISVRLFGFSPNASSYNIQARTGQDLRKTSSKRIISEWGFRRKTMERAKDVRANDEGHFAILWHN